MRNTADVIERGRGCARPIRSPIANAMSVPKSEIVQCSNTESVRLSYRDRIICIAPGLPSRRTGIDVVAVANSEFRVRRHKEMIGLSQVPIQPRIEPVHRVGAGFIHGQRFDARTYGEVTSGLPG